MYLNMNNISRTFLRKADDKIAIFPFLIAFLQQTVKDAVHYSHHIVIDISYIKRYIHIYHISTCEEKSLHVFT